MMKIVDISTYRGRNIYSHFPVIKMIVHTGKEGSIPTTQIEGFNEWVLQEFPGLKTNVCGLGYEGGFLERLASGTLLAHVVEHVILEMQYMAGYNVTFGKTRVMDKPEYSCIIYEYMNEACGLECGKSAIYIVNNYLRHKKVNVQQTIEKIKAISKDTDLGPSTAAIFNEAKSRGIPVSRLGNESIIQLGYGKYQRRQQATLSDATSCIAVDITSDKHLTKMLLRQQGIPVPEGKLVYSEISALAAAKEIGVPVTIKPFDGNQGKGVHLNLKTEREIKAALKDAFTFSNAAIVERFVVGKDYRVLVVGKKVCAVSERIPACIIGDGEHTVQELVEMVNQSENRGDHHEKPLTKIKLDLGARRILRRQRLAVGSVPEAGRRVLLRENGNLSTGGTAIDRTDEIHPDNEEIAIRAATALGVDIAGIDFVTEDIAKPAVKDGGVIVEVNAAPGIRMHLYPSEGTPRNVAKDIVDFLYPQNESAQIPIVSVTGTNGKTTTTRLIAHTLLRAGKSVGMTSTSGTYINGKCIHEGDDTGAMSAAMVLSSKAVDVAVLETARGGILRSGLGYDLADVGIVTNIADDHLGLEGINTLEELAYVKSLVAEAVKDSGCAVLNAESAMTDYILKRIKTKAILFARSPEIFHSRYAGHTKVYVSDGMITVEDDEEAKTIASIREIPITNNGSILCNVENCLAATAALYALSIPAEDIAAGLTTYVQNEGRFDLHVMDGYSILLDYGHNLPGYEAVLQALPSYGAKRMIGIIGMPGDRQNASMKAVGELCARHFQKLYIKEDEHLRGRKKGEVSSILYKAVLGTKYHKQNIVVIDSELQALVHATQNAEQGDLIVVFYEHLKPLLELINERRK